jgi:Trypsin-like peptidase domain
MPKSKKKKKSITMYLLIALTIIWAIPDLKEVYDYEHTAASIVMLTNDAKTSGGTGFELNYGSHQFTVSNAHVCELAKINGGYLLASNPYMFDTKLKVIEQSNTTDLCLLEPIRGLPKLDLRFGEFKKDSTIYMWGHPSLRPLEIAKGLIINPSHIVKVLVGYILTKKDYRDCKKPKNKIEKGWFFDECTEVVRSQMVRIHIETGNSGSPVIDETGRVGGVAFASDPDETMAEIIPWASLYLFLMDYTHELVGLE